jgi:hypothetical protein
VSLVLGITGYSPEYIEEVLHKKKAERATATLAIDLHRPTFIKVNRKYLHPDTLDHYGLPWEWDAVCTTFYCFRLKRAWNAALVPTSPRVTVSIRPGFLHSHPKLHPATSQLCTC